MSLDQNTTKSILLKQSYITEEEAEAASAYAKEHSADITEYFFDKGILTRDLLREAMGEYFGVPPVYIEKEHIDDDVFFTLPQLVAQSQGAVGLSRTENGIKVAMVDPSDIAVRALIEKRYGEPIVACVMLAQDLPELLKRYKADIKKELEQMIQTLKKTPGSKRANQDSVVVKAVDLLLYYGYEQRTSDIHIEPYTDKILVRFRIDGVLHDIFELPKTLSELILSRIKVMSKMRTDEHRAAQDGKLSFIPDDSTKEEDVTKQSSERVDVRVSIVPVTHGENVVMRLLSSKSRRFHLQDIGFSEGDMKKIKRVIKNPHGMILVTGPTGSGKTTTLYAVMTILNTRDVHIATIEDPVEYDIEGVSQIQVNVKAKLTFANGLRAVVRQDPDVIMVGEIRDEETASIAVNSALTGHLVLSTLHTNDAATTLPRLLDMGIEPFLVASTVNVAIAQRLVRKICESCRVSYTMTQKEQKLIAQLPLMKSFLQGRKGKSKKTNKSRLYKGNGCNLCSNTGYIGRVGIFEVLEVTESIKEKIIQRASSDVIMKAARESGMRTMMEDGIEKALGGVTTLEEILRVASE